MRQKVVLVPTTSGITDLDNMFHVVIDFGPFKALESTVNTNDELTVAIYTRISV